MYHEISVKATQKALVQKQYDENSSIGNKHGHKVLESKDVQITSTNNMMYWMVVILELFRVK